MTTSATTIVQVIVDIPARELSTHFDYVLAEGLQASVGSCVLVDFANRPAVGYVVGVRQGEPEGLKEVSAMLGGPFFGKEAAEVAGWIAARYVAPLSEAVRLFLPPGGTPKAVRTADGAWTLRAASTGEVDDRWAELAEGAAEFTPKPNATMQRALLDALVAGPVRVVELVADLGAVSGALKTLERVGAVRVTSRRRFRDARVRERAAIRHERLTQGQADALSAIEELWASGGGVVALDGVTGSGKTEVYLRAIESCIERGKTACVLVPEISLTPQTVGRFRARFGDSVAVLHSRLSAGERYDQWDLARRGDAPIVVGARSALFAPLKNVGLIVIDEEHESSYKQSSAPRYHAREVAEQLAARFGATLVLGSASLSMETRERAAGGEWALVEMPDRVEGRKLPAVEVVDMGAEFAAGHRSMFSRPLASALHEAREAGSKAVLFLNRRGFASFLLCRECGYVPRCDSCATSLTFHDVGNRLMCHHCGSVRAVPPVCPECESPYLRQFGAGTQRVESELNTLLPDWPVVRMDADTTKGKGAHERLLAAFEAVESGVLLGTQMIAKGLDYPEVTLVGVVAADTTLNVPDFRAGERTYQLLEQVAGHAGRGEKAGKVVIQTYWPEHPAIRAAAAHDPGQFYPAEREARKELGYPPFGRLANVLVWGRHAEDVRTAAMTLSAAIAERVPVGWELRGPSPAPLERLKGVWRWHLLLKAPVAADISTPIADALSASKLPKEVSVAADIDPIDLL